MTALPVVTPVTTPLPALIVATPVLLLDQAVVTPPVASVRVIVLPWQTLGGLVGPAIAATVGAGFTVTVTVIGAELHPLAMPIIVKFDCCCVFTIFVSAPGIVVVPPGPVGSIPIRFAVLSLTQLKAVPAILLFRIIVVNGTPEQTVWVAGSAVITGAAVTT